MSNSQKIEKLLNPKKIKKSVFKKGNLDDNLYTRELAKMLRKRSERHRKQLLRSS